MAIETAPPLPDIGTGTTLLTRPCRVNMPNGLVRAAFLLTRQKQKRRAISCAPSIVLLRSVVTGNRTATSWISWRTIAVPLAGWSAPGRVR